LLPNYEQPYEALFEQTNDAVVILDPQGIYVAANKRCAEMLGYERDELIGKPMSIAVRMTDYDESEQVMARLLEGERIPLYERVLVRKDGEEILVEINASLVRDGNGEPAYLQATTRSTGTATRS